MLYNASVYRNDAGEIIGVFAAARDVMAQKQASQYARSLIEESMDMVAAQAEEKDLNLAYAVSYGTPDTGIGMPKDKMDRLFQPFTQLEYENLSAQKPLSILVAEDNPSNQKVLVEMLKTPRL